MKKQQSLKLRLEILDRVRSQGYIVTGDGKILHREIYKSAYGPIPKDWVVHHVDENKINNAPENLIAMPRRIHELVHAIARREKTQLTKVQIEQLIKCHANLSKGRDYKIEFTIIVSQEQLLPEQQVTGKIVEVKRSGSAGYR